VPLPNGYKALNTNYMVKGFCPQCTES
jgi:hypothetical protein